MNKALISIYLTTQCLAYNGYKYLLNKKKQIGMFTLWLSF